MFKTGTGKKIGSLSVSSTFYSDTYQIELVLIPNFSPNRIPYAEKDFPLAPDQEPIVNQKEKEMRLNTDFDFKPLYLTAI